MIKQLGSGIHKGSILSPILFLIVINHPLTDITSPSALYADDFCFWESESHIEHLFERCQVSQSEVERWCTKWSFKSLFQNRQQSSTKKGNQAHFL